MSVGMVFGEAFEAFVETFKKYPFKTSVTIILFLILVFLGSAQKVRDSEDLIEYREIKDSTYSQQIDQLDGVENNLKSLLVFISNQKQSIEENRAALSEISEERSKASELLSMDKKQIELIFLAQEERQEKNRWKDLAIGIAVGVVGSLVASLIMNVISTYRKEHV